MCPLLLVVGVVLVGLPITPLGAAPGCILRPAGCAPAVSPCLHGPLLYTFAPLPHTPIYPWVPPALP